MPGTEVIHYNNIDIYPTAVVASQYEIQIERRFMLVSGSLAKCRSGTKHKTEFEQVFRFLAYKIMTKIDFISVVFRRLAYE